MHYCVVEDIVPDYTDDEEVQNSTQVKFIYSEKATKFCEVSTSDLSYVVTVKSTVEILQNSQNI